MQSLDTPYRAGGTPNISDVLSFYDPNHTAKSPESIAEALLKRPPVDGLSPETLLLAELKHIGFSDDTLRTVTESLSLPEEAFERAEKTVTTYTQELGQRVLTQVATVREYLKPKRKTSYLSTIDSEGVDVLLAGAVLSASSHAYDRKRLSGSPYYTHPRDVANIIEIAWRQHLAATRPLLDLYKKQAVGLNHDAWENAFRADGGSFLDTKRPIISPYVFAHTLGRVGLSEHEAHAAGSDLRTVTKQTAYDGTKQQYATYIAGREWSEDSVTAKVADINHNLRIDRKPLGIETNTPATNKVFRRYGEYREAEFELLTRLDSDFATTLMLGRIGLMTSADLHTAQNLLVLNTLPTNRLIMQ
jgi:hypothetical protein